MASMSMKRGGSLRVHGYKTDAENKTPPQLLISIDSGGLSSQIGMLTPFEAREIAKMLISEADAAEGRAA